MSRPQKRVYGPMYYQGPFYPIPSIPYDRILQAVFLGPSRRMLIICQNISAEATQLDIG
ncbi:MAG: hypothetical protein QNJ17_04320 [Desulfocapsaceae bacterium]|nr:hypothetical protein [Desulfocapsaceae bacterium]